MFTASGIDSYTLKFNTSNHSSAYSSTAIANTTSGISGGSINQLLLHSGVTGGTTYYYQIQAIKNGKTYYYAVYAKNGNTLSTSAATGNASLSNVTSTSTATQLAVSNTQLSSPSNFDDLTTSSEQATDTSQVRSWSLTGGSGDTTVTFTKVSGDNIGTPKFAASKTDSTPDSYVNSGTTTNLGTMSGSGNIYVRCQSYYSGVLAGNSAVYRVTVQNNGVSDSADINIEVSFV